MILQSFCRDKTREGEEVMGKAVVRFHDYDGEPSSVTFPAVDLTAANFDAQVAALASLRTALEGIAVDLQTGHFIGNDYVIVEGSAARASSPLAQRENKWLVRYHDSSGAYRLTIPCADLTVLDPDNRGFMDLQGTEGAAFVSAFEAYVNHGGGAVTVDSVQFVGRNT